MSNTRIASLIEHCRTCPAMLRPDVYKYKFVCYACNYFTYQVSNIKNHILIHLGAKPFVCELCQCTFRHNHHLQRHMKTHSKYNSPPNGLNNPSANIPNGNEHTETSKPNGSLSNGFPDAYLNGLKSLKMESPCTPKMTPPVAIP
uniref:Transcriptional repressor CTCF n=2 Tax=Cacopsylla melanoneura TaxID=428564 RepID=A0A8D8Z5G1_9HEMI